MKEELKKLHAEHTEKARFVQEKLGLIKKRIKAEVLDKLGLEDLHVHSITFSQSGDCGPGSKQVCQYFGLDPFGRPIIKCSCIPDFDQ